MDKTAINLLYQRVLILRDALEKIENLGAEFPEEDRSTEMFRLANSALRVDDGLELRMENEQGEFHGEGVA